MFEEYERICPLCQLVSVIYIFEHACSAFRRLLYRNPFDDLPNAVSTGGETC